MAKFRRNVKAPARGGRRAAEEDEGMLLAGDVGGTKTLLGIYEAAAPLLRAPERPRERHVRRFATTDYGSLDEIVSAFLATLPAPVALDAAVLGVAGPVRDNASALTNVPWRVDGAAVAERFHVPAVRLVNDLVATGYAVPVLAPGERAVLQEGRPDAGGNAALIAPGTGCGEALLHRVDGRFLPVPSEAGHADFAARTPAEVRLLEALTARFGRASYEHILSGPGLGHLYAAAHAGGRCTAADTARIEPPAPADITGAALAERCPACVETVDRFADALGAEAGNLGLRSFATAGVYIGGGIAPRILPRLRSAAFLDAFRAKGPMRALVADMPVVVIDAPHPALMGAAVAAAELAAAAPRVSA